MKKLYIILGIVLGLGILSGAWSLHAYFAGFIIGPQPSTFAVSSLKIATSTLTVSIDPAHPGFPDEEDGSAPYVIHRNQVCDHFDESTFQCAGDPPDLCPYISLEPGQADTNEIGFSTDLTEDVDAKGSLTPDTDPSDDWEMTIASPCFEGECPANYNPSRYGTPLPQSLKNQTFACDVDVHSAEPPVLVRGLVAKHAYADNTRTIRISAILTGGEPPQPVSEPTTTPVIIVPGIMGSYLDDSGGEKWPNLPKMVLPGADSYLNDLGLDESGTGTALIADSIIKEIESRDFFTGLSKQLISKGYFDGKTLYDFPYDWRLNIKSEALTLKNKINEIKKGTSSQKVDIIAHSMGGLLVKEYINQYGGDSLNLFVDIGTPQLGAPKAFKILNFGDDLGFRPLNVSILNSDTIKAISQNMPAIYQLLPSREYFDSNDSDYKYFVWNGNNVNQRLDFNNTKQYLNDAGRNSLLTDLADTFHQEIDSLNPADYGVKTYNIVGCGTPTIGQFYVLGEKNGHTEYDIKLINGDGTVPLRSATAIPATQTYFAKGAVHATMPSTDGVRQLVVDLLTSTSTVDASSYANITSSEDECPAINGTLISFHSPITLDAYDAQGNHSGPDANGDIEQNIPGSDYEVIDDNKFVFLPAGQVYTIKGVATGEGSFDVRVERIVNGEVVTTTMWNELPLTSATHVEFAVNEESPILINLDPDGDGSVNYSIPPNDVQSGFVESLPPTLPPINQEVLPIYGVDQAPPSFGTPTDPGLFMGTWVP